MKKLVCLLLSLLMFTVSCGRDKAVDIALLEKSNDVTSLSLKAHMNQEEDEYYGDYADEEGYTPPDLSEWEGIFPSTTRISGNRYYFTVKKKYQDAQHLTGYGILAYVDLATGEKHYLCNDPLCKHEYRSDCKGLRISVNRTWNDYAIGTVMYVDEEKGTETYSVLLTNLITLEEQDILQYTSMIGTAAESREHTVLYPFSVCGDILYVQAVTDITDVEAKTDTERSEIILYDLKNNTQIQSIPVPQWCNDQEADFFLADEHYLYLFGNGALYLVDHDLQNEKVLCETPQAKTISNTWTYDALTGELYILYGDTADCTGTLYRVKDGECSVVQLPHDNIYHFQLTRDKIYYCVYDTSICYGVSPMDVRVCDYSGGRIYVTDRETHNTAEVFFDNGQDRNLPLCNRWDVIGDYVYVGYSQIMQEGGIAWFSSALYLKKVRINVPDHTIQYFRFD